jgi:hypothetical protein
MKTGTRRSVMETALVLALLLVSVLVLLVILGMVVASPAQAETFTVNSREDFSDVDPGDGVCDTISVQLLNPCTMRGAIQEANAHGGMETIHFDIPGGGVRTIEPNSQLPVVTQRVTIDGYTQPGAAENTMTQGNNAVLRIELDGSSASATCLPDGLLVSASDSVVKGLVINHFSGEGVQLSGSNNRVEGNFIGTDSSGLGTNVGPDDPGNRLSGVIIAQGTSGNFVGGTTPEKRNIISANSGAGVRISGSSSSNKVQGNSIGRAKDGSLLGNGRSGVEISGADDNVVGGTVPGASNSIAGNGGGFSGGNGVTVGGAGSTGNRILRNSITDNGDLRIDLGSAEFGDGVTTNDPKDPDTGANTLQNFPVLTSAAHSRGQTTIKGKLNSKPDKSFTIQFFSNPAEDEGRKFVGQKSVTTNANGNVSFDFQPSQAIPAGQTVTATATDPGGNTSELSEPRTVT